MNSNLRRRIAIVVVAFAVALLTAVVIGGNVRPVSVLALFAVLALVGLAVDVTRSARRRSRSIRA